MPTSSPTEDVHAADGVLPRWALPLFGANGRYSVTPPNPLQVGVDRIFGSLADSLGLTTPRAVLDNVRALAEAEIELGLATVELLGVLGSAYRKAAGLTVDRLAAVRRKEETVDSVQALARVWLGALNKAMHAQMQSREGVDATARMVRVTSEVQLRIENLVGIAVGSVGVPTRRDLDEAYREIQQLKREVRRLRRGVRLNPGEVAEPPADAATSGAGASGGQA